MRFGVISLGAAVLLGAALMGLGAPRVARVTVFLPLWIAGLGVFQARDKT
jgi:hypothetical protein